MQIGCRACHVKECVYGIARAHGNAMEKIVCMVLSVFMVMPWNGMCKVLPVLMGLPVLMVLLLCLWCTPGQACIDVKCLWQDYDSGL